MNAMACPIHASMPETNAQWRTSCTVLAILDCKNKSAFPQNGGRMVHVTQGVDALCVTPALITNPEIVFLERVVKISYRSQH